MFLGPFHYKARKQTVFVHDLAEFQPYLMIDRSVTGVFELLLDSQLILVNVAATRGLGFDLAILPCNPGISSESVFSFILNPALVSWGM